VQAFDLEHRLFAALNLQRLPAKSNSVLRKLIAMTFDGKEDALADKPRLIEGDEPVAVGEEANVVDGLQLDEGNAAARFVVDDLNDERLGVGVRGGPRSEKNGGDQPGGGSAIKTKNTKLQRLRKNKHQELKRCALF